MQLALFLLAERREEISFHRFEQRVRLPESSMACLGQREVVEAAVARVASSLDEPEALQIIHDGDHDRAVNPQYPGNCLLRHWPRMREYTENGVVPRLEAARHERLIQSLLHVLSNPVQHDPRMMRNRIGQWHGTFWRRLHCGLAYRIESGQHPQSVYND